MARVFPVELNQVEEEHFNHGLCVSVCMCVFNILGNEPFSSVDVPFYKPAVLGGSGLQSKFQGRQDYTEKPCLKQNKQKSYSE